MNANAESNVSPGTEQVVFEPMTIHIGAQISGVDGKPSTRLAGEPIVAL
ncbi:MAG: hypothetical protein GY802_21090 [Gammaproteobacteria bacterium]|nr:hypothetical protein [Gammaproteobacteria bacterium]